MKSILFSAFLLAISSLTVADTSLTSVKSPHSVNATLDKFSAALTTKGLTLFTVIDHQQNGQDVNIAINPTKLVIFGNPKIGTKLMQCSQTMAIDLPQKALIWEDNNSQVWVGYNTPQYLHERHKTEGCEAIVKKVTEVLAQLSANAVSP